jgi:hypothetical protein
VTIVVEPFSEKHITAVRQFNKRISDGRVPYQFPESPVPRWLPRRDSFPLYQECFVALNGGIVHGGYILKQQAFVCNDKETVMAGYQLPISEGTVDRQYTPVGPFMVKDALKRQPLLYCLGMGGETEAIVRMLKAMKWSMVACPFYFRVNHAFQFFRNVVYLRRKWSTKVMLDILAFSGMGSVGVKSLQSLKGASQHVTSDFTSKVVEDFSSCADDVWQRARHLYSMIAVRDSAVLNTLYPKRSDRFTRIKVHCRGEAVGWAVVLNTKMEGHNYFGQMRVGSVIDCLAVEGHELSVVAMATRFLEKEKVDIIITNQLHDSWCKAFSSSGYLRGPSNFIFMTSPQLSEMLHPFEQNRSKIHMTRGDGDGPINL